jgi:hypothetical protein
MIESVVTPQETSAFESLARLISGYRVTGVICAAAQLGLPDLVGDDGARADDLARQTDCDADAVYRLLRALASLGIFEERQAGLFVHTPASRLLCRTAEPSLHGLAAFVGMVDVHAWPGIVHSVKTGTPAFEQRFGRGIFEYMQDHREVSEAFDAAMAGYTEVVARAVLDAYDFGPFRRIIDIGGGNGSFLKNVLDRYPRVTGTIYDRDHVVARALAQISGTRWASRLDGIAGNFLQSIPAGGDLYTIKIVLCDWRDDDVLRILRNVRQVIGSARLLIVDAVIPPGNTPCFAKLSDLNMLVTTGSRERTEDDFKKLLADSGFSVAGVRPAHEWVGLVEAVAR